VVTEMLKRLNMLEFLTNSINQLNCKLFQDDTQFTSRACGLIGGTK